MPRPLKKSLTLALICFGVSACDKLPPFPTVEVKLVDAKNDQIHRYNLPTKRGEKAPYLGSVPASFEAINKNFCLAPKEYSKLEQYISALEDLAERKCK